MAGYTFSKQSWDTNSPVAGTIADQLTNTGQPDNRTSVSYNNPSSNKTPTISDSAAQGIYTTGRLAKGFVSGIRDLTNLGLFGYYNYKDKRYLHPQRVAIAKQKADLTFGLPQQTKQLLRKQMSTDWHPHLGDLQGISSQREADEAAYREEDQKESSITAHVPYHLRARDDQNNGYSRVVRNRAQHFLDNAIFSSIPDQGPYMPTRARAILDEQNKVQRESYDTNKDLSDIAIDVSNNAKNMTSWVDDVVKGSGGRNVDIHPLDSDIAKWRDITNMTASGTGKILPVVTAGSMPARAILSSARWLSSAIRSPKVINATSGILGISPEVITPAARTVGGVTNFLAKHPILGYTLQTGGDMITGLNRLGKSVINKTQDVNNTVIRSPYFDIHLTGNMHDTVQDIARRATTYNNAMGYLGKGMTSAATFMPTAQILRMYKRLGQNNPNFWANYTTDNVNDYMTLPNSEKRIIKDGFRSLMDTLKKYINKNDIRVITI